ncbi:MAG: response regulator [Candidatus Eisenbacteria bacterium]|nr:response regulator [Candidatus Eisenbacteria bacterium]
MKEPDGGKILVVEDDLGMAETCVKLFRREGLPAESVYSGEDALQRVLNDLEFDIVLTDLRMPGMDGTELLRRIKEARPEVEVIIMTGYGTIQNAIQAMKIGATDYITKPFDREELLGAVAQILESRRLKHEVARLKQELGDTFGFANLVGRGPSMQRVFSQIRAAARNESSVLIVGESGTGKELVARAIHYASDRKEAPFVPVNCGAIPKELIESELFGHRRGSFTGASQDTMGLFRSAEGGTIFLDEIAEMPIETQATLLRTLQDKRVRAVGDVSEIQVQVRFIAAMNQPVDHALREGKLRQDLYYRIGVIIINLPPLRERPEDIPFLIQSFVEKFNKTFPNAIQGVAPQALQRLQSYAWPGNVRELENVIESSFAVGVERQIQLEHLPDAIRRPASEAAAASEEPRVQALADAERDAVVRALEAAGGNKSQAAEILSISRSRLYKKIRDYGLDRWL